MSIRKKIQWIIHYYGIAIIVGIVAVCVISNLMGRILGEKENYLAKVMILDDRCSEDDRLRIWKELEEELGGVCEVTSYLASDENQFQAFVVRLTGDKLDVIIAPEKEIRELEENSYFQEIYKIEESAYYNQAVDEEAHYMDKDIYLGKTGEREMDPEIQEKMLQYFLNDRK